MSQTISYEKYCRRFRLKVSSWLIKKNINPKQLLSILLIIGLGLAFGFFASGQYGKIELSLTHNHDSKVKQFIIVFAQNYWYFFLLWLSALIPLGFIISYIIIFLKGFIFGVTFSLIIKAEALFGVYSFFKLVLWQFLILLPLFIYLSYYVISISFQSFTSQKISKSKLNFNTYLTLLLFVTIGIVFYSVLVAISSIQMISNN